MSTALHRYAPAVAIGAGAIVSDLTYLMLILFGFFHLIDHPVLMAVMTAIGALFMAYLAWIIWKNRNEPIHSVSTQRASLWRHFLKGYFLTITNPYTLIFWFSVSTYITARELHTVATVAGLLLATSLWVTLMPLMIHKTKHLISQRTATLFSIVSSLILLFFTVGMLWKLAV
jgi:L-lysine exporter family protein LysE/ArgO